MKTIGFIVNEILVDKDFFVDAVIGDTSNTEIYVIENVEGSPNKEAYRASASLQSPNEPAGIQTRSILITPALSARMSLDELLDVEITSLTGSFFSVDEILVFPQYMFVTFTTDRNELEDEILQAELTYSDRVETHTGIFPNLAFECRNVPDTNVWGDDHTSVPATSFWGMVLMGILLVRLGTRTHKEAFKDIRNCNRPVGARPIN
jgi:hypothetical protein